MSESEDKSEEKTDTLTDEHNGDCIISDSKTDCNNNKRDDDKEISETMGNEGNEKGNSEDKTSICDTEEKMDEESAVVNDLEASSGQTKEQYNNTNETKAKDAQPNNLQDEKQNSTVDELARKFRNGFFEAVEELKLRRTLDTENEERITALLTEKNEIHRNWEDEVSKSSVLKDIYEKREVDAVKEYEAKLQQYETNKAKYDVFEQCSAKEMHQLKDEIRALHLAKYSVDKRASELDRELQLQATARENHVKHLAEMEKSYREAVKQSHEVFDLLDQVERNVAAAGRLHRKLTYNNEHQKCQLNSYKQNLEAKQQELAQIKVVLENQKALLSNADNSRKSRDSNEKELRMQTELCRQLENLLTEARDENKNLLDSLKGAQTLVERHVDAVRQHSEMEAMAQFELDEVKSECQDLVTQLQEEREAKKLLQEEMKEKEELWNCEKDEKEKKLSDVKLQLETLTLTHNSLEETNSKLSEQINKLTIEMETLRDKAATDEAAYQKMKEKIEKLIEVKDNERKSLNAQLAEAQNAVLVQSNSVQEWKEKFIIIEEKMQTMSRTLDEVRKENSDLTETKEKMSKEIETDVNEIKSLKAQLVDAKSEAVAQTHVSLQWRDKSRQLEQEVETLSAELNEQKEVCKNTSNSSTQTDGQYYMQETQKDTTQEDAILNKRDSVRDGSVVNFQVHTSKDVKKVIEDSKEVEVKTASHGSNVSVSASTNQHVTTGTTQEVGNNNHPSVKQPMSMEPTIAAKPQTCNVVKKSSDSEQLETKDSTSISSSMSNNIKPVLKSCIGKRHNSEETNGSGTKRVRFKNPVNDVQSDTSDQAVIGNVYENEIQEEKSRMGNRETNERAIITKRVRFTIPVNDTSDQEVIGNVDEIQEEKSRMGNRETNERAIITKRVRFTIPVNATSDQEVIGNVDENEIQEEKCRMGNRETNERTTITKRVRFTIPVNATSDQEVIGNVNKNEIQEKKRRMENRETNERATKRVRVNIPVNDLQSHTSIKTAIDNVDGNEIRDEKEIVESSNNVDNENSQRENAVDLVDGNKLTEPATAATEKHNVNSTLTNQEEGAGSKNECNVAEENGEDLKDSKINSDCQELFSDDEEEGNMVVKSHEVGHQINKIQNFLNNQRLRTNKKRKLTE